MRIRTPLGRAAQAGAAVMAAAACLSVTPVAANALTVAAPSKITIGAMIFDTTVPFFAPEIAGERAEAKALGATYLLRDGQNSLSTEISIVEQFVSQHVSAILLTPSNAVGIQPAVRMANAAHIPVIAVNSNTAHVLTFVGANDTQYGQKLGQAVVQEIGTKGNIAVILGLLGSTPNTDRVNGLHAYLKRYPGVHIVAAQPADWDNQKALAVGEDFLTRFHAGQIKAIVDLGPEGVAPADYAHKIGRTDVKWIVGDVPKAVGAALRNGTVQAAVYQNHAVEGKTAIKDAVAWVKGNHAAVRRPNDYVPLHVITQKNIGTIKPY